MSHGTREPAPNDSRNQDSPLPAYSGRARSRHRQSRIVDSAALEDENVGLRSAPTPHGTTHWALCTILGLRLTTTMDTTALQAFAGAPDLAACMIGEILYAQEVCGKEATARLSSGFLGHSACRPQHQNCLIKIPGLDSRPWREVSKVPFAGYLEALWPDLEDELTSGLTRTRLGPVSPGQQRILRQRPLVRGKPINTGLA